MATYSGPPPITWTGKDIDDDATTKPWLGLVGRAECMGESWVRGTRANPGHAIEDWWASVYEADGNVELWSTNDLAGYIHGTPESAAARARQTVEHAMKAIAFDRGLGR